MGQWNEAKIGEIAEVKGGKRIPKGRKLIKEPNSHPYIRIRNLGKTKYMQLNTDYEYVDEETQQMIARYIVNQGDILISVVGTIGLVGIVGNTLDKANQTENCDKIINIKKVLSEYLYYYLVSSFGQDEIKKGTVGAVQPKLPLKNVKDIIVKYPPIKEQKQIVEILSAIDEKIELNETINNNLADLLQAVYQEQFGDIESAENQGTLSDICMYSKEKVVISALNISNYFSTENMLVDKGGATIASSLPTVAQTTACHKGDTLISNIRPYFKKIVYCEADCGCSADVLCFTPNRPQYSAYLFSSLYADSFFAFMVAGAKGTKMPRGDRQQIMTYPVVLPSNEKLEMFNAIALPTLGQIHSNRAENKRLSAMRDTLLPKLMSGELDVSDIEL